jgi:hypothetical protein
MQARLSPEPDPTAVVWSTRSALLERLVVTGYGTALATIGALVLASAWPARAARIAAAVALVSTAAVVVQTVVAP